MTIGRYIAWEILRLFGAVLAILAILFAGYCAAGILADAVNGLLPVQEIARIVGLKVMISLEVLVPISLLMAVLLAFGRLYGDSEVTAMAALTVSPARIAGPVFGVSLALALGVAAVSLWGRPWAYQRLHAIAARGAMLLNVDAMRAGVFYSWQGGQRVIHLGRRQDLRAPAEDVFVQLTYPDHTEIIHAARAARVAAGADEIDLAGAHIYKFGTDAGYSDEVVEAGDMVVDPDLTEAAGPGKYNTAALGSRRLAAVADAAPADPADVAEWQWRLSNPVSTLLLGMLGLPLGRVRPRQNRFARFGTAILIYGVYYLLCMSARSWVAQGEMPRLPGLWWAPALLGLTLAWVAAPGWTARVLVRARARVWSRAPAAA